MNVADHTSSNKKWGLFVTAFFLACIQKIVLSIRAEQVLSLQHKTVTLHKILIDLFYQWDSGWYAEIATSGYTNIRQTAFFPVYPLAIRLVHISTGLSYRTAGALISFICFLFALYVFALYVQRVIGSTKVTVIAMLLLTCFPTAYYFQAVYTESIFLCFALWGVYAANRNQFWRAGILVSIATLTRNTGIFLTFILFFEYIRYREMDLRFWTTKWWRKLRWNAVGLCLPAITFLLYCFIEKMTTGYFFPFLLAEKTFNRSFMPSWYTLFYTGKKVFQTSGWLHEYFSIEWYSYLLMVGMLLVGIKYFRRSWTFVGWFLYSAAVLWASTSQPCLNIQDYVVSLPRYVLMLFPSFIIGADLLRKGWLLPTGLLVLSLGYLYHLSGIFFTGQWIS